MANRKSEPFSAVDAAWLHMETPTNSATITGVFMFDQPINWKHFRESIESRFLIFKRFKMRVKEPFLGIGTPKWEIDPHFSLDSHIHRMALPAPGGQEELQEMVGDLMSQQLDFTKPLWQMYLVENYGAGCALISRIHHSVADGLALVQVLLSMTEEESNQPRPAKSGSKSLAKTVTRTLSNAESLLYEGIETISDPGRVLDVAKLGLSGTQALGKLLLTLPDSKTLFRGQCGVPKRAAWTPPIKLEDVKTVSKAFDSTINDILISCLAGGLRRYLEGRNQPTQGLNMRAMVPVNLRKPEETDQLGNRFGLVILSLPVGIEDPIKRLRVLKKRMDAIKNSPEAIVAFGLLGTMGLTPVQVEKVLLRFFAAKVSGVMTNVPGPRQTLYFCGRPIRGLMFWVPTPGNLSLGTSIISYDGNVIVGVATDAGIAPDPEAIVKRFQDEFKAMYSRLQPARPKPVALPERMPMALEAEASDHANVHALCKALTKTGKPCKNRALPGMTTCTRHVPKAEAKRPLRNQTITH
ncbi:MAG: wax ester/triacylglycerol synthase family O-acyltransferase [Anaerolineae bacterium]